ncbi:sucrose-phosphate phosphatase [Aerosakkonemataceae cyanobacterium BLCC-F154]|uniref:sucrose-phosphate phosphatase n=1 Tax=Floridaenema fluviatile BLCC-F154 TaxID=3153640 RepID=A0ABV4YJW6_9CYAN
MAKFLFVTDLDNTLVGDDQSLAELNQKLKQHRQEYDTKIVYTTGRSLTLYQQLTEEKNLLVPDALVTAVGTEIYYHVDNDPDPSWSEKMMVGWDRELVINTASHFADLTPQPETEQRPFKVSYFLAEIVAADVLSELEDLLQKRGLNVRLIYSGSKDLDIIPRRGNKGAAMQFLRQHWDISPTQTVVCGDSGNDIALFSMDRERGIIVGNAQPELLRWCEINPADYRYQAKSYYAAGILEGLYYFGFFK